MMNRAASFVAGRRVAAVATLLFLISGKLALAQLVHARAASPGYPPQASATYLGLDTTTSGNWRSHYGSDGYIIPNSSNSLPSYVQLKIGVQPSRNSCSDPGCLQTADETSRSWNQWASSTSFTIDINLIDGKAHKISFYAYDFYNTGAIQNLSVKDATTGIALSTQTMSNIHGVYQLWEVRGHAIVTVNSRLSFLNASINGIFFDPPPPVTTPSYLIISERNQPTPLAIRDPTDPNYSTSQLEARISALPSGGTVTLSDRRTPVRLNERLTVAQLRSLKFVPSPSTTTASRFAYTVTDPGQRTAEGFVMIVAAVAPPLPLPPNCSAAGMEAAPIIRNDRKQPVSLLVPRSSITPSEIAVLINDADPQSIVVGKYFQLRHGIPDANVIHLKLDLSPAAGANFTISMQDFAALKSQVDSRVTPHIQAYAIAWTQPYAVFGGASGSVGITSAFTYGYDGGKGGPPHYYNNSTYEPYRDFQIRPAMMLSGDAPQDVISLIDRGALAQQTLPPGNGYFVRTTDVTRSVRYPSFIEAVNDWNHPGGLHMTYIDDSAAAKSNFIQNTASVLFYETGLQGVPAIDSNRYLPGALADHLTSFGGNLLASYQMSILDWIHAGVTASYGTVTEPGADPRKFPQATVLVARYFGGNTAVEAYNKSVYMPYQGVFVGDPLARPFGTNASVARGMLSIKTSVLQQGATYTLLASQSCTGPFITLRSEISAPLRSYSTITVKAGPYPYYELVED